MDDNLYTNATVLKTRVIGLQGILYVGLSCMLLELTKLYKISRFKTHC